MQQLEADFDEVMPPQKQANKQSDVEMKEEPIRKVTAAKSGPPKGKAPVFLGIDIECDPQYRKKM